MTNASLCKKTYKNGMRFHGSNASGTRALSRSCLPILLFLAAGSAWPQSATLTVSPITLPSGLVGAPYLSQLTATGGSAPYMWSLESFSSPDTGIPPGMTMSGSGAISGTPTLAGTFSFPVQVNDNFSDFGSADIHITIAPMTITTPGLPGATTGVPYSVQLQVNGGIAPIQWFVESEDSARPNSSAKSPLANILRSAIKPPGGRQLPLGLTLNQNTGVISGTPTSVGVSQFTILAEDEAMNSAFRTLSIDVSPCLPTVAPASPLPPGDVGLPYSQINFTASGCPGSTYTYSEQPVDPFNPNTLPPGLNLTSSGTLKGTPTTIGTFTFLVTLTDQNQQQTPVQYSISINPLATFTTQSPLPNGPVGVPYSQQIAATGGTPPYIFDMNANPPGITITQSGVLNGTPTKGGTYNFNIGVTDSLGAQTVAPFQVTFATPVSQIQAAPLSLIFNANLNGNPPPTQAIGIVPANGATPPVNFRVVVDSGQNGTAAPSWITVTPTNGQAPAGLVVSVDQGFLAVGSYSARIQLLDSSGLTTDVAVTLNVTSVAQQLTVAPALLNFAARSATPGNLVEELVVSNSGPGSLTFTTSVVGNSPWISNVTASSNTTTRNAPIFVQVQVNTTGLQVGAYNDTIQLSTSAGNTNIPVSLFIAASGPILAVDTTGVLFQAIEGGGSTATQIVKILNLGDSTSTVNWTATLVSGSNWLNLVSSSGTATSSTQGVLTLALAPNATQLTAGPYYAIVKISDSNSQNSPQYVTAVLNLQPSTTAPAPDIAPAGLFFTTPVGGTVPPAQQVQINTSSASAVTFNATAATIGSTGPWLTVTPGTGNASGQTVGSIAVSVNPSGLAAGIYSGNVNVSVGMVLQSVNVTFVVQPTTSTSAVSQFRPEAAGCAASKLAITETSLANNFAVPAGWPATLIVQLNDDCASPVTTGHVVASFSNGDAALNLTGDSLGNYSTTWQPGAVNSQMVVTLNATSGTLQPAIAKLYGGIAQNQTPPPTIVPDGTLNNLNPVVGAPLSPGTIAQVYGSGLASSAGSTGVLPLPTTFNNTYALVGNVKAPLYFLSSGQINLQIPSEVAANQQAPIILSVNNAITLPLMLNLIPAAPGVASLSGGTIIAQHADYSLVTSSSPAKPGEVVIIYLVGMGATNPSVASGTPSPSSPLATVTLQPTVTVDSQPANIVFAGLTPGSVGLYQIDFQVPSNATSGNLNVVITQNGITANSTVLPVSN